jgi:hypothetical protein
MYNIPDPTSNTDTSSLCDIPSRNDNYRTREVDIRKKILEMSHPETMIQSVYKETLRAVKGIFSGLFTRDAENKLKDVKLIIANQERAVAKIMQEDNIILPIISVAQTTTDSDQSRGRYESVLVNEKYWDDKKQRAVRVLSFAPVPVTINYQLNVWSKYAEDMDQILEQIRLKFNPELTIHNKFGTITKAYIEGESITGTVQAADKEDRVLRKQITLGVRTHIPNPKFLYTSTGKIEKLSTDFDIS